MTIKRLWGISTLVAVLAAVWVCPLLSCGSAAPALAQVSKDPRPKPGPAPEARVEFVGRPDLRLKGAEAVRYNGVPQTKVILTVANWKLFPPSWFVEEVGLPYHSCLPNKDQKQPRVVIRFYSEDGHQINTCKGILKKESLATEYLYFPKPAPTPIPQFLYMVLTDARTGKTYKSNLVSPWTGETK